MLILPIQEVKPGAKLALSVMHPRQRNQELLKAGFVLDETIVARLSSMGVQQVFVDFPGLDDLDRLVAPLLSPERKEIYEQVRSTIAGSEQSNRPVVKFAAYVEATRNFVKTIMGRSENAILLDVLNKTDDEIEHATAVAHLALVLGLKLDAYLIRERSRLAPSHAKDITNLGVAAMLHDIGKSKLPPELRKYHTLNQPAAAADLKEWQKHAIIGYEMIRGGVDATTSATVLHHHQRFDGDGFPEIARQDATVKLSGPQIHCFARILAVADLFQRISVRPDGTNRTNYQSLHYLRTHHSDACDPEVLAALPQVIPPFSPGRRVKLSDQTEAVVTGFTPFAPYQPVVKRINIATMQLSDEAIDLRDSDLTIEALDGHPLQALEKETLVFSTDAPATPAAAKSAAA